MIYKNINDLDEGAKNKLIGCLSLIIFSTIRTGNLTKKQKETIKEIRLVRIEGGNRQIRKFSIDESFLAGFDCFYYMTRDEFIWAVNRFEKLERTQMEFSNELDKVLCKYTDNQNCTFTSYCAQACELGIYWLVRFAFPKLTAEEVKAEVDYFTGDCDYGKDPRDVEFKGKEYLLDGAGSFYDYLSDL